MSRTVDRLARDPVFERAFHEFENSERRPIRLAPAPAAPKATPYRVLVTVNGEKLLTLSFQDAPPVLTPQRLYQHALTRRLEFRPGSVAYVALTVFCEAAQDWRRWPDVFRCVGIPLQGLEQAVERGFTFDVKRG